MLGIVRPIGRRLRALGRRFRRPLNIQKSWEETPSSFQDMTSFLNWFDRASSVAEAVERGRLDWSHRFATGTYFDGIRKGTALEIGFGAGRLLVHAARDFERVIGIDIHSNFAMSERFIASQGIRNATLLHRDALLTVPDHSVDFVYSFIVFQHFDNAAEVDFYLSHILRLLAPGGIAQIYYGKKTGSGMAVTSPAQFQLRDCSLFIAPETMRDLVKQRFDVLDYRDTLARDPASGSGESVQAMVLFRPRQSADALLDRSSD
jgi:SAM-dependent methyltransferase